MCSFRYYFILHFALILSNLNFFQVFCKRKGQTQIDKDKPYKSYVGKILPKNDDKDIQQLSQIIERLAAEKVNYISHSYNRADDDEDEGSKGRSMKKAKGRSMGKESAVIKGKGRSAKKKKDDAENLSDILKRISKEQVNYISKSYNIEANHGRSFVKDKAKPKAKGRMIQALEQKLEGKEKWFVKDPEKHLGRAMEYDPNDPKEPKPSEKLEGESEKKEEDDEEGGGEEKAEGGSEKGGKDAGGDGASKKKGGKGGRTLPKVRPEVIANGEIDPEAPGWFALKDNSEFGAPLRLGTLLRKKQDFQEEDDDENGLEMDGLGDAEDGDNKDASEKMSSANRKYDKACLWQEYEALKETIVGPQVSERVRTKVKYQNMQLANFFVDIVFRSPIKEFNESSPLMKQEPNTGLELLHLTKDIFFNNVCRNKEFVEEPYDPATDKMVPQPWFETAYHLWLKLYDLTKNSQATNYLDESEFSWIKKNLEECNQTREGIHPRYYRILNKTIEWFQDECQETAIAYDYYNNYACTPYIEYDFNIKKYDPILDFVWHMIASVHSHCFDSFQSNIRMWHRYALTMADLFTPEMRTRWLASTEDTKKLYVRFFGPYYSSLFDNMNRCMYAATLRSNVPYLLPRFATSRGTRFAPFEVQQFGDGGGGDAAKKA